MILRYFEENRLRNFNHKDELTNEIKFKEYHLNKRVNLDNIIRIINTLMDKRFYDGNFEKPECLVLGVDLYEGVLSEVYKTSKMISFEEFMGMKVMIDFKDKENIALRDSAQVEFMNYIKHKNKEKNNG